jgi:glycosyltransferase involved in cell wall biosynthesis
MADLEREYGFGFGGRVIPNGRSSELFASAKKRHMVLAASRCWDESKNLSVLQQAAASSEWPIYVAGDLAHDRQPRTQGINFLGRLCPSALAAWYSRAAIFVSPAKYDPFGMAPLEAALSGCALVLADIPSLREQWEGAALFAAPDSPLAFAEALRELSEDSDLRAELASAAGERAKQFNATSMVCGYLFAYQDLKQMCGLDLAVLSHPGVSLL